MLNEGYIGILRGRNSLPFLLHIVTHANTCPLIMTSLVRNPDDNVVRVSLFKLNMELITQEQVKALAGFKDPFTQGNFLRASIDIWPAMRSVRQGKSIECSIHFKVGETSANHKLFVDTLPEAAEAIQLFLNSLPK